MNLFGIGKKPNTSIEQIDEDIKKLGRDFTKEFEKARNERKEQEEEMKKLRLELETLKKIQTENANEMTNWSNEMATDVNEIKKESKTIIKRLAEIQKIATKFCAWKKEYQQEHIRAEQMFTDIETELTMPKQVTGKSRLITPPDDQNQHL